VLFRFVTGTMLLLLVPKRRQRPLSAASWQRRRAQIVGDLSWNRIIAMELIQSYKGTLHPFGPGSSELF